MYNFLLSFHSIVRWLVVIAALAAFGKAFAGWLGKGSWTRLDDRLGLFFTITMDIQALIGILLYIFSPLVRTALAHFSLALSDPTQLFFSLFHEILMLVAVALAHIGRSRARKAEGDSLKFRTAAVFYGLSILVVLVAIPWPFTFGRPWIRL
ncbi:MAG TPA: hypothetical protein VMC09_10030 [Anaerolineales bacterium]|nr:hypothetical protein [Anaerolineales bacterium]